MATYHVATAADGGSDSNAGTALSPWLTIPHASSSMAAGDTCYIKGHAGNAASFPTSGLDYTIAGGAYFTPPAGTQTAGWTTWIADPAGPMPTIGVGGLAYYNCVLNLFDGLYFCATGVNTYTFGIINWSNACRVRGCVINLNGQAGLPAIKATGGGITATTIRGGATVASSGATGVLLQGGSSTMLVAGCAISGCGDCGIDDAANGGLQVVNNRIYGNKGDGIALGTASTTYGALVQGNTIDGNAGHGIDVIGVGGIMCTAIYNNIMTNHTGTGKYGLYVADGTAATNDARKRIVDYNNLFGNTGGGSGGNYGNISAGAHDLAVDPQYVNAGTGDFTPQAAAVKGAGFPPYLDMGGVQHQDTGGGGGVTGGFRRIDLSGGMS